MKEKIGYFEYVFDLVGGNISEMCAELIDVFGTYAGITFLTTDHAKEILFDKATKVINVANYAPTLKSSSEKFEYYGNALKELFEKIEKNIISPTEIDIVGTLTVETVQNAHLRMENNLTNGRKLIMTIK
jgi:NADPH2:quinone reductase